MIANHASDVVLSAAAGVIATVPMTIAMEQLHRLDPHERSRPLPPREITEAVVRRLAPRDVEEDELQRLTLLSHYAFGGVAGALFPLMAPKRTAPAVGAGVLYGLAVWSGSYLGLLPAFGVRHHAAKDSTSRSAIMIAAHLVWGASLGLMLRGRPGLRAASNQPDAVDTDDA